MRSRLFQVPRITRLRMALALLVAVWADGVQFVLGWLFGPVEWALVDPVIDAIAAMLTNWILGFHFLLLPTFLIKLVPIAEELPTWTACVTAVIALRKRTQSLDQAKPPMIDSHHGTP